MKIEYLPHENEIVKKKFRKDGKQYYRSTCRSCGKIVEYSHGGKPSECPYCSCDDYVKPITETRLFRLQDKYLKTRDDSILWSMFIIFREYSASLIKKSLPSTFTYHYQKVEEKASDLALIMFEEYKNKSHFKIMKSFGAYLNTKVPQVLWNKRDQNEENHESLSAEYFEGSDVEVQEVYNKLEMTSLSSEYQEYLEKKRDKKELYNGINQVLEQIFKEIKNNYENYYYILSVIGVWHYIKKQGHMENFYDTFGINVKEAVDRSMVLFYEFLQEH